MGVTGVASYTLLPDAQKVDKEAVIQAVSQSGADAVLVTRLIKVETVTQTADVSPRLEDYLGPADAGAYDLPDASQHEVVSLESKFFGAPTKEMIWSGTTTTFDPVDLQKAASEVSGVIAKELAKQKLI
jgi:hypothetical protein